MLIKNAADREGDVAALKSLCSRQDVSEDAFMLLLPFLVEDPEYWPAALAYAVSGGKSDLAARVMAAAPEGALGRKAAESAFKFFASDGAGEMDPVLAVTLAGLGEGMEPAGMMETARQMLARPMAGDRGCAPEKGEGLIPAFKGLVRFALDSGAGIDWRDNFDGTSLLGQAVYDSAPPSVVEWLLEQGANPLCPTAIQGNVLGLSRWQQGCEFTPGYEEIERRQRENWRLIQARMAREEGDEIGEGIAPGKAKKAGQKTRT